MTGRRGRAGGPPLVFASACVALLMTVVYAGLRAAEGLASVLAPASLPWLILMVAAVIAVASSIGVESPRGARRLLAGSMVLSVLIGIGNIYGVGLGFLIAATMEAVALGSRSGPHPR